MRLEMAGTECVACTSCPAGKFVATCSVNTMGSYVYDDMCAPCSAESCKYTQYLKGCGGVSAGVCTDCPACASDCGGTSAGNCSSSASGMDGGSDSRGGWDSSRLIPFIPAIIVGVVFLGFGCGCLRMVRIARLNAAALALREEKLRAEGLACIRLVNHAGVAVEVRRRARD